MDELDVYLNKSEMRYVLFDIPLGLIIYESNDIQNIRTYITTTVNDFGEEALGDILLASKEIGFIKGDELMQFFEGNDA